MLQTQVTLTQKTFSVHLTLINPGGGGGELCKSLPFSQLHLVFCVETVKVKKYCFIRISNGTAIRSWDINKAVFVRLPKKRKGPYQGGLTLCRLQQGIFRQSFLTGSTTAVSFVFLTYFISLYTCREML